MSSKIWKNGELKLETGYWKFGYWLLVTVCRSFCLFLKGARSAGGICLCRCCLLGIGCVS